MVRVKGPLFSMDASGSLGKAVVFSKWKGRAYVRAHAIPSNPRSGLQVGIRTVMGFLSQYFSSLTAGELSDWEDLAEDESITAINALCRDGVQRARRNEGWRSDPTSAAGSDPGPPTSASATAALKSLTYEWTDDVTVGPDFCTAVHLNEGATADTPDISNLVGIVEHGTETFTIRGLTTGQAYSASLRHINSCGEIGTAVEVLDETPL